MKPIITSYFAFVAGYYLIPVTQNLGLLAGLVLILGFFFLVRSQTEES